VFSCVLLYDLFAVLSSGTVCMFYLFTYIILSFCCKRRSRGVDARYGVGLINEGRVRENVACREYPYISFDFFLWRPYTMSSVANRQRYPACQGRNAGKIRSAIV